MPPNRNAIMKRLLEHISKSLAVLAVVLLPVEQALAASCCCRGGSGRVAHVADGFQKSCCTQSQAACCGTASGSQPCHCSIECYGQDAPNTIDPAMFRTSSDDEAVVGVLLTIALDAAGIAAPGLLRSTASPSPIRGAQRCVLLCRYRL